MLLIYPELDVLSCIFVPIICKAALIDFLFLSETQSEEIISLNNAWSICPFAFLLPDNF